MPRLTQPIVDRYKADADGKVRTVPDAGQPGLYLLVHPTGRKAWVVMYRRADRKQRKLTLQGFPSLDTARKLTREAINKVAEGSDPAAEKQEAKRAVAPRVGLVDDAFHLFMEKHVRTKKGRPIRESTRRETARLLGFKRDPAKPDTWIKSGGGVLTHWAGKRLDSIKPSDVRDVLDELKERGPIMANRTLTALKTCFTWHVRREALDKSPCDNVDPPTGEGDGSGRERVLSDDELAAAWRAAEAEGYAFGRMVQLLILTGCRRDEVREAPWAEFDLTKRAWLIPGNRTKNGRDHLVPLSDSAISLLENLPRIKGKGLLFTTTGETAISGLSKIKARLEKAAAEELNKLDQVPAPWTLHDLRRTLATGLQKLGFPVEVSEAVLNHRGGTVSGVAAIYARHDYAAEKREALDAWARHVAAVVNGRPADNVIKMPSKRSS